MTQPQAPVSVGSLVADKYRIEALLDAGGMGAVFRARHELMDKPVALKCLLPELAHDTALRDRFIREARMAARIRHPHVVDVYDVGVHEGALFLVMEYLEGESFDRVLERGNLPVGSALKLLMDSMRGVDAAHRLNIIHRDVKPENIFVVFDAQHPDGHAKVLDFGISKLTDEPLPVDSITGQGQTLGTPLYMSYEQMNGASDLDARTDVYSFGVLLYRVLTGALPFKSDSFAALAVEVATERPALPSQRHADVPTAFDAVIMKALAFDRAERYATLSELIDALETIAPSVGAAEAPVVRGRDSRLGSVRNGALALSLLVGVSGLGWVSTKLSSAVPPTKHISRVQPAATERLTSLQPEPLVEDPGLARALPGQTLTQTEKRIADRTVGAREPAAATRPQAQRRAAKRTRSVNRPEPVRTTRPEAAEPTPTPAEAPTKAGIASGQRSGKLRRDQL